MITLVSNDAIATRYLEDIVSHAGLGWRWRSAAELDDTDRVLVVTGPDALGSDARERIRALVTNGAALVVTGGTAGLDDLLGATEQGAATEGYLIGPDADHPATAGLHNPLHVFQAMPLGTSGGTALATLAGTDATSDVGAGVVTNRAGSGATVAIGANIPASVLHIQAGTPVLEDGAPAPDGSAPIDDDILKAEDGMVLSWEHDRQQTAAGPVPQSDGIDPNFPDGDTPWFSVPIADELRLLLLQSIAWAASEAGIPLARLHEWPEGLAAVGTISHDSDLNVDASAHKTLELLELAGIHSTWCHMYGPTYENVYEPDTFPKIFEAGHEFALHYNSLPKDGGEWGKEHLAWQADFVRKEAGVEGFVSNKNHYTRWEGTVEFFHWLVDEGIQIDHTRGPSKKGTVGYPLGSSLPTMPLDPETGAFIDVLALPMQFQDLWLTTPPYMKETTIAASIRHRGVAHFLFHQIHLFSKPMVAKAFLDVIEDGRSAGLDWWTTQRINDWERLRRQVTVSVEGDEVRISTPEAITGAVIEVLVPGGAGATRLHQQGTPIATDSATSWNQTVLSARLDLPAGETVLTLGSGTQGANGGVGGASAQGMGFSAF